MARTAPSTAPTPVVISGLGHYYPPTRLDNAFFADLDIGTDAAWIEDRVGIRARHSVLAVEDIQNLRHGRSTRADLVADGRIMSIDAMCVEPWQLVRQRAALDQRPHVQVDHLLAGTSVPDWDIPANACAIGATLGLECAAFDVNSACSSFVVGLHVARALLTAGQAQTVALFNPERYSTRMDFADRASCILFGDGASGALIEARSGAERRPGLEVLDTMIQSSPAGHLHVQIPDGGCFRQNGSVVQKFAVSKTLAVINTLLTKHDLQAKDLAYFIGHQANYRMLAMVCQKAGLRPEQHLFNVDVRGNQGGAGAPAVLSENWERYRPGDLILVAVVGAGLTWGGALLRRV